VLGGTLANGTGIVLSDAIVGPGLLGTTGAQIFSGDKTFSGNVSITNLTLPNNAIFSKTNSNAVLFTAPSSSTVSTQTDLFASVNGKTVIVTSATSVSMPSLAAGSNYVVWLLPAGTLQATLNSASAPVSGSRVIGGFHYAPGGNATGFNTGGNATPAINPYSFWDLKWLPKCQNLVNGLPAATGMALVANSFWADIYLLNTNPDVNTTSKYGVQIASGASSSTFPNIPAAFAETGFSKYSTFTWYEAGEVMSAYGKRLPTYREYSALAYGTSELVAISSDPVNSGLGNGSTPGAGVNINGYAYTSKWGVIQSSGVYFVWGQDVSASGATLTAGHTAASYTASNGNSRGQVYQDTNENLRAAVFGGYWIYASVSGSRYSFWASAFSGSGGDISARGVCDHLILV
jgi:hypothetical protein